MEGKKLDELLADPKIPQKTKRMLLDSHYERKMGEPSFEVVFFGVLGLAALAAYSCNATKSADEVKPADVHPKPFIEEQKYR